MRTILYVDGFNFYYGALRNTPHKWLDLHRLFTLALQPHNQIVCIKYFTARISATPNDPLKSDHQDAYLRALNTLRLASTSTLGNSPRIKQKPSS